MNLIPVSRKALEQSIAEATVNSWNQGRNRWNYVRVYPDGTITNGQEASKTIPESECFRTPKPHPLTVWTQTTSFNPGPLDGVYEWEECEESEAEFFGAENSENIRLERDDRFNKPYRLTQTLIEPIDTDSLNWPEIERDLNAAGYELTE